MVEFYDRDGRPITAAEYGRLFSDEYKRVAETTVDTPTGERAWVSTIWLGIDHGFGEVTPPLIFETMVFGGADYDRYARRHSTEADARAGHAQTVAALEAGEEAADD